jgi:hypothetical protein
MLDYNIFKEKTSHVLAYLEDIKLGNITDMKLIKGKIRIKLIGNNVPTSVIKSIEKYLQSIYLAQLKMS